MAPDICKITDAGMEHLRGLRQLDNVWARETRVTRAGAEQLESIAKYVEFEVRLTVAAASRGTAYGLG